MSSTIYQLSCFSAIICKRCLQLRSQPYSSSINFRRVKVSNVMSSDGRGTEVPSFENKSAPSYIEDVSVTQNGSSSKSHPDSEEFITGSTTNGHLQEQVVSQPKGAAKIHDFCLGIPFGAFVLCGGVISFIFSRNPATLSTGVIFGSVLLVLSTFSLKTWRQGKSSLPLILGQAVISVALLWKNTQAYQLTKRLFPTGFNLVLSAAMLCFYSYVVLSGGNPPPKKSKSPAAVESY